LNPKISIITVVYNNKDGLLQTIKSVFNQNYINKEYIIIDGGSTDGSKELLESYGNTIDYWISEKDNGIYSAMNKGIQMASGDYCIFLNSGDYFIDNFTLSELIAYSNMENIIFGDLVYKNKIEEFTVVSPDELSLFYFVNNTLPHPCTLIRKELFSLYGSYDEDYLICADWVFFIDMICKHHVSYKHVQKPTAVFLLGGLSSRAESELIILKEKNKHLTKSYKDYYDLYKKYRVLAERSDALKRSRIIRCASFFFPEQLKSSIYFIFVLIYCLT
jgi:glycosyltransferase involved in cell wall biosynthesis